MTTRLQIILLPSLLLLLGASACQADDDGPSLEPTAQATPRGGARTEPRDPVRDRDGDGVPDDRDRCETPRIGKTDGQGRFARHVSLETGCDEVVLPRLCHGDTAPPRMVLGIQPSALFVNGASVRSVVLDGHPAFEIAMPSSEDADLVEDCPEMASYISAVFKIGGEYRSWLCQGRETKKVVGLTSGPTVIRQSSVDTVNPCFFDPTEVGLTAAQVSQALAAGQVHAVLLFHAKDAVGNILTTNLGDGAIGGGTCGFTSHRSAYQQVAAVTPISCPAPCSTPPTVSLGLQHVALHPVPTGLGGPTIVQTDPTLQVTQVLTVSSSCGAPQVSGALSRLVAGNTVLVHPEGGSSVPKSLPCTSQPGPGAGQVTVKCVIKPSRIEYAASGAQVHADLHLAVKTGSQVITRQIAVSQPL